MLLTATRASPISISSDLIRQDSCVLLPSPFFMTIRTKD